jgi:hypothetical protein
MKHSLICAALLCVVHGAAASAQEKPANYTITTGAYQFDASSNTYSFEVRFSANPCPGVNYNIPFAAAGMKDSEEALARFKPQIDKIASDLAKDQQKRCSTH